MLILEVLSPITSALDRGAKFAAYRKPPTLREYVLIHPERLSLDLFHRKGDSKGNSQRWVRQPIIEAGGQAEWASVGLQLPLEALYEHVALPQELHGHPDSGSGAG